MSVKEMFVVPKETYFRLMNNVSEVQKQDIEAINVDQVNVSCGPLLVGLKKNTKEKPSNQKKKSEETKRGNSTVKTPPTTPTLSRVIGVSTSLAPPPSSSQIAVKNTSTTSPSLTTTSKIASAQSTPAPTIASPPSSQINVKNTPTAAPLTTNSQSNPTTVSPPSSVVNSLSIPKSIATNENIKPVDSQSNVLNMILNKDISKPYGDQERMFNQDSIQKTPSLNGKSALDVVNTAIMKQVNNSQNQQELAEVSSSAKNTKKPIAVHSLVDNFDKVAASGKKTDSIDEGKKPAALSQPSKNDAARTGFKRTSMPGTRTVVQEKGITDRAKRRAKGELIVTPDKKMKTVNYKNQL